MTSKDADRWGPYNSAQVGRDVRPLAILAAEAAGEANGRTAVELGCGIGREAAFLAGLGWHVKTYDADPTVVPTLAHLGTGNSVMHTQARLETLTDLPACDLLLASACLPFVPRTEFPSLWAEILRALRPGAVLAVDLFGDRDDWASESEGTFLTRDEVDALVANLNVVRLHEDERQGPAFSGPRHWHTYQIIAIRD